MFKYKWCLLSHLFPLVAAGEVSLMTVEEGSEKVLQGEVHLTVTSQPRELDQVHYQQLIDELLEDFKDLFVEPTALPPTRALDHSINLKPSAKPINIRSYRYSPIQKIETEKMVKDMLNQSFIRRMDLSVFALITVN